MRKQREISSTGFGGAVEYDLLPSPSFLSQASNTSFDFNSLYNSIMIPPNSLLIGESSSGGESQALEATTSGIPHSLLLLDQQYHRDLMNRHNAVLAHLRETAKQAQALRQENINLKMANLDLNNRLTLLLQASSDYAAKFDTPSKFGVRRKSVPVGDDESTSQGQQLWEDVGATSSGDCHESPTSVMDSGRVEENNVDRVRLPKSISVRSSGYLKTAQASGSTPENRSKSSHTAQRVYLKGAKKEEQPLELEVYNQGMFKTELCNKWQETGACPYADNCQFAHGLEELRPVLRHPRYKTEVCRMVLNGDPCPYGHRCHFRHSLTDQEKLIRALNSRSLNSSLSS